MTGRPPLPAWRASRVVLYERIAAIVAVPALIYGLPDLNARVVIVAVITITIVALTAEHRRVRHHPLIQATASR